MRALLLLVAAGCGPEGKLRDEPKGNGIYDPGPTDDTADDTAPPDCQTTLGTVTGVVTGPYSGDPNPDAIVFASPERGATERADADEEGTYSFELDEGWWTFYATSWGCYSNEIGVAVVPCKEATVDLRIEDCDKADKPNLYLHPARPVPTQVRLELAPRQEVVASDPPYRGGWSGVAWPDGTFSTAEGRAPFLFYEVSLATWQSRRLQRTEGWCVAGGVEQAVAEMAGILDAWGFDAAEVDDFVEAWRHDLPPASTYAVYPQTEVDVFAGLTIEPHLDVDRLWLVVDEAPACHIPYEPAVVPFARRGAHAVEWGVILGDLVR